jgi:hypothetical protein
VRQGLVSGPGGGADGRAPGVPEREGPGVGIAADAAMPAATRGAGPPARPGTSANAADARAHGSPGALRVDAVFTRMPVPPMLRQYVLRYFDELGIPANGEDPS